MSSRVDQGSYQVDPGIAFQTLSLATGSYDRQAGHIHPLASARLSTVLEDGIEAPRAASHSWRTPEADRGNGNGNPAWCEERIAAEQLLKVGIRISTRTVRSYMPEDSKSGGVTPAGVNRGFRLPPQ